MKDYALDLLEEAAGQKFYVEYVGTIPTGNWFKIHMTRGTTYNITIDSKEAVSIEDAKLQIIDQFKETLRTKR
ncbi:hypothetical protein [Mesobacillus zeae]|uniref:hypothetical protein n=1 Tax=Mesobacillus zeae TaxID=1917180 RepID=UPI00300BB559